MSKIDVEKILLVLLIVISIAATYYSFSHNIILVYNDAASHMNIARRVVDSLTPGMAQIGTVWLPLPHVLMIPFAINDWMWHTGLAGSITSMISYIVGALLLYKLIFLLTNNRIGSFIGFLIFIANPNLLYFQTTPMTEPLLLCSIIAATYFLIKYVKEKKVMDLILCGVSVAASTLIRYDGWFLFVCLAVMIPLYNIFAQGKKRAESSLVLFLCAGGFGIFLWFLWNLTIFGDPLYFISGPYSAAAQQKVLASVGQLPTKGDMLTAAFYYMWSVIENNGIILVIAAFLGVFLLPFILKQKSYLFMILIIFTPIVFNVIALFVGQSAMNILQAPENPGLFNIRYGMMALPAIAVVLGILASNKYLRFGIVGLFLVQSYFFVQQGAPITLVDGAAGLKNTYYTVAGSKWLRENYDHGLILTSLASHDAFVARAQIPMRNYIHEGTREYWTESLTDPLKYATYVTVLTDPPDSVYRSVSKTQSFKNNFTKVYNYNKFEIYKRNDK